MAKHRTEKSAKRAWALLCAAAGKRQSACESGAERELCAAVRGDVLKKREWTNDRGHLGGSYIGGSGIAAALQDALSVRASVQAADTDHSPVSRLGAHSG